MTRQPPSSPDDAAAALRRLQHELDHPPFHAALGGPRAISADPASGTVVLEVPYQQSFRRACDSGDIHGGVLAAVVDMAAHAAIAVQCGRMTPTVDLRIDYLRPAPAGDLSVTARTLKVGRAIGRADVEIRSGDGAVVAVGRGTFSTLK